MGGGRRPMLGRKKRGGTPFPGSAGMTVTVRDRGSVRKSRLVLHPVPRRAMASAILTARPASNSADCSATPVRTTGWSMCINAITFQYGDVAPRTQQARVSSKVPNGLTPRLAAGGGS